MSDQKQHSDDAPNPPILHEKVSDQISETDEASSLPIQHEEVKYVLRKVMLRNFVKFQDLQELSFEENGAYYLIGENQSGKSSVFEGIRRCLSLKNNSSMSSACDRDRDSIVVCNFEGAGGSHHLISFYIRQANSENNFFKGCVILQHNEITKHGVDHIEIKNDKFVLNNSVDTRPEAGLFEEKVMNKDEWLDRLTKWVTQSQNKHKCEPLLVRIMKWLTQFQSKYKCEPLLEDLKNVVFTLPMRGIGALQWTKSKKISIDCRKSNYKDASKRAEVIRWYLENKQENMEDEETIYDVITNGKGGKYSLDGTTILNNGCPILKLSEGFLEAKLCSILLSSKEITTVGLEDPGTGMHIQMVERLRNVMTDKVKDKVVIVSTHNPHFIKPELVRNMYFLHRRKDGKCIVIPGTDLSDELMHAIPGSVSTDQFATMCFAEQIAFVEGPSDILFMDALLTFLRKEKLLKYNIHFISMGGGTKFGYFRKFCKVLHKKYFFLLDNDMERKARMCIRKQLEEEKNAGETKQLYKVLETGIRFKASETHLLDKAEETKLLDKAEETELLDKAEETKLLDKAEETKLLDKAEETELLDKAEETELLDKAEETELLDKAEETKLLDKAEETKLLDKAEETELLDKAEETKLLDKAEETELLDKAEETKLLDKAEETELLDKAEETKLLDKAEETELLDKAEETELLDKAEETELLDKAEETKLLDKAEETKLLDKAEETELLDKAEETKLLDKAEETELLDKAEETKLLDNVVLTELLVNEELKYNVFIWDCKIKNIEYLFFGEGFFSTLKGNTIKVTAIKEVINRCVNKNGKGRVTFTKEDVIDEIVDPLRFKMFLNGTETFEDRIQLFKYLMDETCKVLQDSQAGKSLKALRDCLERFAG